MLDDGTIVESAPAKLNLALHVRRRRADGYHELETLFAFAQDGDEITLSRAAAPSLTITGPFSADLNAGSDNLVSRAVAAFRGAFQVHGHQAVILEKRLPIASGIGGGSADAAATLRALARLHGVPLDSELLMRCAASLGADVPPCLLGRTALGTGRGDDLTVLEPLGGVPALLVNPRVAVSTASVFAGWDGVDRGPIIAGGSVMERARAGRNDLAASATMLAPAVAEVLAWLQDAPGVAFVRMSGSGATCFALFDSAAMRHAAAIALARERPGWWMLETSLA
ncbi:4-(cytidine 5'-diphospho)-2-C-methyl-D-erythritol kinase [Sphingomonas bacterium]|uniref:4-(cytidine 5'-diphospho)-2-C-methyl-D-erythritol kinase n=1 Tax=Sphingomonas bacterium TaxID=1895847 RepID=UPI0015757687|nr:4-(cytidine 5'-diphospho)-2-C-methyl-D-erythritol kinase [Sphingomonas bacterium]